MHMLVAHFMWSEPVGICVVISCRYNTLVYVSICNWFKCLFLFYNTLDRIIYFLALSWH